MERREWQKRTAFQYEVVCDHHRVPDVFHSREKLRPGWLMNHTGITAAYVFELDGLTIRKN